MGKGFSLNIGLNSVDPGHYDGWSGELVACEADAKDMSLMAKSGGYKTTLLLTKAATRNAVLKGLDAAAKALNSGDTLFLTYSGHGGQLPDHNDDEADCLDETWCLFDGELVDDELYSALGKFKNGVRIFVLSDSCHSGTMLKMNLLGVSDSPSADGVRYRAMPDHIASRTYLANQKFYDAILKNKKIANAKASVAASALLISGCQDNQLSSDGPFNGLFTGTLKVVWNGGKFAGNYAKLHSEIVKRMPHNQTPNLFKVGAANAKFDNEKPLTI